jgi:glycosyltransferase involved in cell wall biosynthesis
MRRLATLVRPKRIAPPPQPPADVCLIVEGCYPYVAGGVSSWLDWLMRSQPEVTFRVVALVARAMPRTVRYAPPPNLLGVEDLVLDPAVPPAGLRPPRVRREAADAVADGLVSLLGGGGLPELERLARLARSGAVRFEDLARSRAMLDIIRRASREAAPALSFLQLYWACRALLAGLLATLAHPLPPARCYHAISTGYAGLLAARAAIETGRPAALTEHGIYANERRIDLLLADWIADTIEREPAAEVAHADLRELWARAFESLSRACYGRARVVTTLYGDNQVTQVELGAGAGRLEVIANGIDAARFEALPQAGPELAPTMALIGRVVPIKDVKTYIRAAALVRRRFPGLRALVMGPTEEDPAYFAACRSLAAELDLDDCLAFTGNVRLLDHLASLHVVCLTSLSEAQPLVLLEAGAAGIACVATDVGACREIIEGRADESPPLGPGGIVTALGAVEEIADAVCRLLGDPQLRLGYGAALRRRVAASYGAEQARARYAALYRDLIGAPAERGIGEAA